MMKYLIPLLIAVILIPTAVHAAPTSWDFANSILQPLQSQWSALIKGNNFQATSTTAINTFPQLLSTNSTSTNATTTALDITSLLTFDGITGDEWTDFCTTITGSADLCDGSDDSGAGTSAFEIATTSSIAIPELAYFTKTSGRTTLGGVGTTSLTASSPLSLSQPINVLGSSASALTLDTSGTWTGNAGTASALAANGANCSSGNAPLGVDASGAVEDCFDVWTEAENTAAAYAAQATTLTINGTAGQISSSAGSQSLAANRTWTLSLPSHVNFPGDFEATNATTTNATTSSLYVTGLTSALSLFDANGQATEYAGIDCTNQFVRDVSAAGAGTCATVGAADVSLANLTATDSTLTFSGTYNGSTARTIGLNLGNANVWTALQQFANASSSVLSANYAQFGGTATTTFTTDGKVGIGTAAPDYLLHVKGSGSEVGLSFQDVDGDSVGPYIETFDDSSSPAPFDLVSQFGMIGRDSAANRTFYGFIENYILDTTDGSEDSYLRFTTLLGGANNDTLHVGGDVNGALNGILIGNGSGSGTLSSQGNQDLILQTGNSTTGNITITDGANGDITLTPNGSGAVRIATELEPTTTGLPLGTGSNRWTDLFLEDSAAINFGTGGDVTLTHTAGNLTISAGDRLTVDYASTTALSGVNLDVTGILSAVTGIFTQTLRIPYASVLSFAGNGDFGVDSTSFQVQYRANSATRVLGDGNFYPAFSYSTSTAWTGTTTIPLGPAYTGETWNGVKCFTDTGTLQVSFNDGTNRMNFMSASTTVGTIALSNNNTFTASEKRYVDIGTPASSPTKISCTVSKSLTAD